jgi:hypothetical protein
VRIEKTIGEQTIHLPEGVPCPLTMAVLGVFQHEIGQSLELVEDFLAVLHFYPSGRLTVSGTLARFFKRCAAEPALFFPGDQGKPACAVPHIVLILDDLCRQLHFLDRLKFCHGL